MIMNMTAFKFVLRDYSMGKDLGFRIIFAETKFRAKELISNVSIQNSNQEWKLAASQLIGEGELGAYFYSL
jgi:hypothetical protein